MFVDIIEVFTL